MTSVSAAFQNLSVGSTPPDTPATSPRYMLTQTYSRWQIQKVSAREFPHTSKFFVTVHFPDAYHQQIPLGQFVQLANFGIDHLVYDFKNRTIDFSFKDSEEGAQFAKRLEQSIHSHFQPQCPPSSPQEIALFDSWKITDAEAVPNQGVPAVIVGFEDLDSRNECFSQLSLIAENDVEGMRIPLKIPRVDFLFQTATERNSFLEIVNKKLHKTKLEEFAMRYGPKDAF